MHTEFSPRFAWAKYMPETVGVKEKLNFPLPIGAPTPEKPCGPKIVYSKTEGTRAVGLLN